MACLCVRVRERLNVTSAESIPPDTKRPFLAQPFEPPPGRCRSAPGQIAVAVGFHRRRRSDERNAVRPEVRTLPATACRPCRGSSNPGSPCAACGREFGPEGHPDVSAAETWRASTLLGKRGSADGLDLGGAPEAAIVEAEVERAMAEQVPGQVGPLPWRGRGSPRRSCRPPGRRCRRRIDRSRARRSRPERPSRGRRGAPPETVRSRGRRRKRRPGCVGGASPSDRRSGRAGG